VAVAIQADAKVIEAIRAMIERIEIKPGPDSKKPVDITVGGLLAGLLSASTNDPQQYRGLLVAGKRSYRCRPSLQIVL